MKMKRLLTLIVAMILMLVSTNAEAGHPKRHKLRKPHKPRIEKVIVATNRPALGKTLNVRPINGYKVKKKMKKGRISYWIADGVVYRIDKVKGKKVYVVVEYLVS